MVDAIHTTPVKFFKNWETETGEFEEGELLEVVAEGLPFILEESPDDNQITYSYRIWRVRIGKEIFRRKVRYILEERPTDDRRHSPLPNEDRFITVNGKQIF